MDKVKKIALILLIWLLTIFFVSIVQISPIPTSLTTASFFQIPVIFWVVMVISPFLLYIIAKDSKNPFVPLLCVILYLFLFYSWGLYFFSHPTISDITSSARFQDILSSITHISPKEIDAEKFISTARYFAWPIFFIFSKIFTTILGIGAIQTINFGFFSLLLIIPFFLSFFYKRSDTIEKFPKSLESSSSFSPYTYLYFILPALYLTLSWHFMDSQFVPQFLALIYLFIVFGCYLKYRDWQNPLFLVLMVIFYALMVFTHPFIFIFFLVAVIFELYWSEYVEMEKSKFFSQWLIIIFFAMLFPYIGYYYSLASTSGGGQSWRIFQRFLSQRTPTESAGPQLQFLYQLVPAIYDQLISSVTKVAIVAVFSIVTIGLIYYMLKKRELFNFDISVLIGSAVWFVLGLLNLVLGQRALQVAALPISKQFKHLHKLFSFLPKIVIVIILLAPSLFVANNVINASITGERLIQNLEENIAGRFMDKHITNKSVTASVQNAYPSGFPNKPNVISITNINNYNYRKGIFYFFLDSPKLQKYLMYLNMSIPTRQNDFVIYNNKDIRVVRSQIEMN